MDQRLIPERRDEPFTFGCDGCVMTNTSACGDCVVTHLCGPVVVQLDELRAIKALQQGGLLPADRYTTASRG